MAGVASCSAIFCLRGSCQYLVRNYGSAAKWPFPCRELVQRYRIALLDIRGMNARQRLTVLLVGTDRCRTGQCGARLHRVDCLLGGAVIPPYGVKRIQHYLAPRGVGGNRQGQGQENKQRTEHPGDGPRELMSEMPVLWIGALCELCDPLGAILPVMGVTGHHRRECDREASCGRRARVEHISRTHQERGIGLKALVGWFHRILDPHRPEDKAGRITQIRLDLGTLRVGIGTSATIPIVPINKAAKSLFLGRSHRPISSTRQKIQEEVDLGCFAIEECRAFAPKGQAAAVEGNGIHLTRSGSMSFIIVRAAVVAPCGPVHTSAQEISRPSANAPRTCAPRTLPPASRRFSAEIRPCNASTICRLIDKPEPECWPNFSPVGRSE